MGLTVLDGAGGGGAGRVGWSLGGGGEAKAKEEARQASLLPRSTLLARCSDDPHRLVQVQVLGRVAKRLQTHVAVSFALL
jgi:hypothetical protein